MYPQNLPQLIKDKYEAAIADGHIKFTPSSSEIVEHNGVEFQLTFAPSLDKKPEREDGPKRNPFAEPEPELTVLADVNDDYKLLLNKFPVVPEHLLLVTKKEESQNNAPSPKDLITAWNLLHALPGNHLVFYNCGENSGSSQDHKHLQSFKLPDNFRPFQDSVVGGEEPFIPTAKIEPLYAKNMPFAHFIVPLPKECDEDHLAMAFMGLLQRSMTVQRNAELETKGYNVLMTKKWLCVVPRSKAKCGDLGINSTGFAGLVLAKNEELLSFLKEKTVEQVLLEVGFPTTNGAKGDEYDY